MKNTAEINKETTFQLKTFAGFKDVLVEPEKVEKYQKFIPGTGERLFAMMEKENRRTDTNLRRSRLMSGRNWQF